MIRATGDARVSQEEALQQPAHLWRGESLAWVGMTEMLEMRGMILGHLFIGTGLSHRIQVALDQVAILSGREETIIDTGIGGERLSQNPIRLFFLLLVL